MEEVPENKIIDVKPRYNKRKIVRNTCVLLLATAVGYIHYSYVQELHENMTHFSHLSDLEREMSLETEMGFYYSYYKTIVQERPFIAGITKLMYDRLVEYPKDVNAFNRFNIHPEVILGAIYRYLEPWLNTSRVCHMVDRGADLPAVRSCVGAGQPIIFYLQAVWTLAGLLCATVALHAYVLSESVFGGMIAVLQYFANHAEATRVQRTPNERENFAAPLLFLQMFLITLQLREEKKSRTCFQLQVSIVIINCLCLLFWQLTQFVFLTQTAIFFVMEQIRIIDLKTLCVLLHSHFCGLHMAVLLLQGNDMLKSSLYTSFFLVVSTYCLFFSSFRIKVRTKTDFLIESWLVILRIAIVILFSIYLKKFISDFLDVEEDNHIWDLLYSKFTDFKSFHTMIYTCAGVFDFLPLSYVKNVSLTCLLPLAVLSIVNICIHWINKATKETMRFVDMKYTKCKKEMESEKRIENKMAAVEAKQNGVDTDSDTDDSGIENNSETVNLNNKRLDLDKIDDNSKSNGKENDETTDMFIYFLSSLNIDPALFYNISQLVVFGVMAWLFMRLKLFLTTQLCVISSLCVSPKLDIHMPKYLRPVLITLVLACSVKHMHKNILQEMSYIGEYSDVNKEELLEWIIRETPQNAVFAGSMPILASVMLSTRRPIVAHPHYEHKEARDRAYAIYKTYGRFSPLELYQELSKLQATFLIVEAKLCYRKSDKGCTFLDVWDVEAPSYRHNGQLCHTLLTETTDHLYKIFSNRDYAVFRIHDLSVRYMPRVFDI